MNNLTTYEWAVIGAGPAGIAAVGQLLDHHIEPRKILWIDPEFQVGDFGQCWPNVMSNTKVHLFNQFLRAVRSFEYQTIQHQFAISELPEDQTCALHYMASPLQKITQKLREKVNSREGFVTHIDRINGLLKISDGHTSHLTRNTILAFGAEPITLPYPNFSTIPLSTALDKQKLVNCVHPEESIAVFGSSHSAIMALQYLCELNISHIVNVYRSACRYAMDMNDWILFDNTGLKGTTALWAKKNIDGTWPKALYRVHTSDIALPEQLKPCRKAIYATGFKRRKTICINQSHEYRYNSLTGIIELGIYGCGIAFPESKQDPIGIQEEQVGLWKFMVYLEKIIPIWIRYNEVFK